MFRKKLKKQKAFSLVEVLIVVFIMSVAFMSFYTVSTVGTKYIIESKNRLSATALVNEKMEIVRNLSYDNVGIQGDLSMPGNLLEEENMSVNGRVFNVITSASFIDDPLSIDGVWPADTIPNDYKVIKVTVSWNDSNGQLQSVSSVSRFVPPGLETSVGGSPLAINVSSSSSDPVSDASVHITNNTTTPVVNDTIHTDVDGHIMAPAATVANDYHLTISKDGYETIDTMNSSAIFFPTYPHLNIVADYLNTYNYIQNKLADITVKTIDYRDNPIGNTDFTIGGGKIIGRDENSVDIFNMSNTAGNELFGLANTTGTTGAVSGEKEYAAISPGNYNIAMNPDVQNGYMFIDFDPSESPVVLGADADLTYKIRVAAESIPALFLKITDSSGNPVANAEVTMKDNLDAEIFSGKISSARGVVFYPDGANSLVNGNYTLKVEATGFDTEESIAIIINNLTEKDVQLTSS